MIIIILQGPFYHLNNVMSSDDCYYKYLQIETTQISMVTETEIYLGKLVIDRSGTIAKFDDLLHTIVQPNDFSELPVTHNSTAENVDRLKSIEVMSEFKASFS